LFTIVGERHHNEAIVVVVDVFTFSTLALPFFLLVLPQSITLLALSANPIAQMILHA